MSDSIYRKADLSRMRGVWTMEGGKLGIVTAAMQCVHPLALTGVRLEPSHCWSPDGSFFDLRTPHAFNLTDQIGSLGDLRRGAERLAFERNFVAAACLYLLLGDEEAANEAIQRQREQIELERQADEAKPF